jgi:Trypsin-like peptidase domain
MPRRNRDRNRHNRKSDREPVVNTSSQIRPALNRLSLKLNLDPLVARSIGLHVLEALSPFVGMLAITRTENPAATDVFTNGTGTLVGTGAGNLLVTNHHVYEEFKRCRSELPCSQLAMSGVDGRPFVDISNQPCVASDKSCDLAVLAISPAIVEQQGKRFCLTPVWPPQRPEEGMRVVAIGYPGQGRHVLASDALGVAPLSIGRRITSISERHFVMADQTQDAYTHVPEGLRALTSYGGISGSAVYSVHRIHDRFVDYRLCGFVYEEGIGHTLMVAHADHINADGSIR